MSSTLGHIAREQAEGKRLSSDELDFINRAIFEDPPKGGGCSAVQPRVVHGWYVDLFYDRDALAFKPTIADVHTQPTDPEGNPVGLVLHVGTALPRLVVVRIEAGGASREYLGLVSSYREVIMTRALTRGSPK